MKSQAISITDVPMAVWEQVQEGLWHYFVPILTLRKHEGKPVPELIGSGTLIDIDGKRCILTAAHVWAKAQGVDLLYLLIKKPGRALVKIPYANISARTLWNRESPEEWGPDLALLEIPPPQLTTINAYKSFLNFEQQLADLSENPPKIENAVWVIYGVVGEFSKVSVDNKRRIDTELVARAFFGGVTQTHSIAGFDYFDARVDLRLPEVPARFGGVSGGGLWQVNLSISDSGVYSWDGRRRFRGVAFWQSEATDDQRIVRCHGPCSIFQRFLSEGGQGG